MNISDRFVWLRTVIAAEPRPTMAEVAVAVVMAEHFNDGRGMAWPAQHTIAGMVRMDRRSVRRALAGLEARGFISPVRSGGPKTSTGFALTSTGGATQRHQVASHSAISGRSTAPSDGALQRHEQVGTRSEAVVFRNSAANARGCAGAPPRARGGQRQQGRRVLTAPTHL